MMLERKGHMVHTASSGKEAINLIFKNNYDRIVCDLMLQDITGFDVIEESKKKISAQQIQSTFIIITAYTSEQILERADSYQCPILRKPFENLHYAIEFISKTQEENHGDRTDRENNHCSQTRA